MAKVTGIGGVFVKSKGDPGVRLRTLEDLDAGRPEVREQLAEVIENGRFALYSAHDWPVRDHRAAARRSSA